MAERAPEGFESELDAELEHYIEKGEPGWMRQLLTEQAQRSPWWTISCLVHIILLLVMWRWPCRHLIAEEESTEIEVPLLRERPPDLIAKPQDPPPLDFDDELLQKINHEVYTPLPRFKEPLGLPIDEPVVDDPGREIEPVIDQFDLSLTPPILAVRTKVGRLGADPMSGRLGGGRIGRPGEPGGATPPTQISVQSGLLWLAKAQERDGRWDARRWGGSDHYDTAATGLALLAYLGAAHTHTRGRYKTTVRRGLNWLIANQDDNGRFRCRTFYEHGIAAMAVSEAYALAPSPRLKRIAQRAIDYIVRTQPEHGGFRYGGAVPRSEGDMSVTGWQIMALKSATCSDLVVPEEAVERFRTFLRNASRDYGKSAYTVGGGPGGPTIWAIGMCCQQFLGGDFDAQITDCAEALLKHGRTVSANHARGRDRFVGDLYFTYYTTLGMFQMRGEYWHEWNLLFSKPLVRAQVRERRDGRGRYVRGSWDPAGHQWGSRGGRVYTTAMAVLSLEVYYRFLPLYRRK